jgi:hypothetical protein
MGPAGVVAARASACSLIELRSVPLPAVLVGERHIPAVLIDARETARVVEHHQGQ